MDYISAVFDIDTLQAGSTAEADAEVKFAQLWKSSLVDMGAIVEEGSELIIDGDDSGSYLIGFGRDLGDVVIIKINPDTGLPNKYAVVPLTVNWNDPLNEPEEWKNSGFGAAFYYLKGADTRIFLSANEGWG